MSKRNGSPPSRHPERSKGSSDLASSPLQEIPHCIRDDGVSGRADRSKLDMKPEDLLLIQSILKQWAPHCDVWAYGSRVSGHCHESSDLDLVVRKAHTIRRRQQEEGERPPQNRRKLEQGRPIKEQQALVAVHGLGLGTKSAQSVHQICRNYK